MIARWESRRTTRSPSPDSRADRRYGEHCSTRFGSIFAYRWPHVRPDDSLQSPKRMIWNSDETTGKRASLRGTLGALPFHHTRSTSLVSISRGMARQGRLGRQHVVGCASGHRRCGPRRRSGRSRCRWGRRTSARERAPGAIPDKLHKATEAVLSASCCGTVIPRTPRPVSWRSCRSPA